MEALLSSREGWSHGATWEVPEPICAVLPIAPALTTPRIWRCTEPAGAGISSTSTAALRLVLWRIGGRGGDEWGSQPLSGCSSSQAVAHPRKVRCLRLSRRRRSRTSRSGPLDVTAVRRPSGRPGPIRTVGTRARARCDPGDGSFGRVCGIATPTCEQVYGKRCCGMHPNGE